MPDQQKILEQFRAALPETTDLTDGQVGILSKMDRLGLDLVFLWLLLMTRKMKTLNNSWQVRILLNHLGIELSEEPRAQFRQCHQL